MGHYDVAQGFFFSVRDLDFSFVLRLLFFHVLYVRSFSTYIVIIYRPLRGFYGNFSMRILRICELGKMSKSCSQSLKLYQFVCVLPFLITFC